MNYKQEDSFTMIGTTVSVVDQFQSDWKDNIAFKTTFTEVRNIYSEITKNKDFQMQTTKSATEEKKEDRLVLYERALYLQKRIISYAKAKGMIELYTSVYMAPSVFKRLRDSDFIGVCNNILQKGFEYNEGLKNYGATPSVYSDLETAFEKFNQIVYSPREMEAKIKHTRENIDKGIKQASSLLTTRLDLDIEMFKESSPMFYSEYLTARMIIPTGNRKVAVKGMVKLKDIDKAIAGVKLTFHLLEDSEGIEPEKGTVKPKEKKTTEKGGFRIQHLAEGKYLVKAHKMGLVDEDLEITVVDRETTDVRIEMMKR